jgi:ubiquinone/menaquinone biosynthesis C-methylase UbiE
MGQVIVVTTQDKSKEVEFFDQHAVRAEYNVFTDSANRKLVDTVVRLSGLATGARVADLGCGSGVFASLLHARGYNVVGLDISPKLLQLARTKYPQISFLEGDVEALPFPDESFDGVLLSGIVHHLPDPSKCAAEVYRVLKPSGRFVSFDPNRRNPFMWLYRTKSSPFYSAKGVTENEQPVVAECVADMFAVAGFQTHTSYLSGLSYRYVASSLARLGLPVYNLLDSVVFRPGIMRRFSPFVFTFGNK